MYSSADVRLCIAVSSTKDAFTAPVVFSVAIMPVLWIAEFPSGGINLTTESGRAGGRTRLHLPMPCPAWLRDIAGDKLPGTRQKATFSCELRGAVNIEVPTDGTFSLRSRSSSLFWPDEAQYCQEMCGFPADSFIVETKDRFQLASSIAISERWVHDAKRSTVCS